MRYAYQTSKDNAKRRKKPFDISFEDYSDFAVKVDYLRKKGITATSMHIDCIVDEIGYTKDNIQPLENSQNVKKYLDYRWNPERRKMDYETITIKSERTNEAPF